MRDLLEVARDLRVSGADLETVLSELRRLGAPQVDCLKIVREVEGVRLGRAKEIVDASLTWADQQATNEQFRAGIADTWAELDE
jgi:ribosomal protein L7/L12